MGGTVFSPALLFFHAKHSVLYTLWPTYSLRDSKVQTVSLLPPSTVLETQPQGQNAAPCMRTLPWGNLCSWLPPQPRGSSLNFTARITVNPDNSDRKEGGCTC